MSLTGYEPSGAVTGTISVTAPNHPPIESSSVGKPPVARNSRGTLSAGRWDRSQHSYPCPETDRIDAVLNWLEQSTIRLNRDDLAWADRSAARLRGEARSRGIVNDAPTTMADELLGRRCELAYCRWAGIEWPASLNSFHAPDCGRITQVRSARRITDCLIFRSHKLPGQLQRDNPDHHFVLVLCLSVPEFRIVGWLPGRDCERLGVWRAPNDRPPAYFVEQEHLLTDFTHCDDPEYR